MLEEHDLYPQAQVCLLSRDADTKVAQTHATAERWRRGEFVLGQSGVAAISEPGRPSKPRLVDKAHLPKRGMQSKEERAALIHALCHIEFTAINLAWDAVYRFRGLPSAFYSDWIQVADEEAHHFSMLRDYLKTQNYDYGDFSAHDGLWQMALETAHDPLVRMALVPRVLEARGLDVISGIMLRFRESGHHDVVEILTVIQSDEVGHVDIGSRWFHYLCKQRDLDSEIVFRELLEKHMKNYIKGSIDRVARRQAGFSEQELDYLDGTG
ncbi:MAG TPA: ferritin-like domain-containing protein [Gammaproteobacteria bacterium]|nr:ferritin-like domain-containing protein [Gammaproteobacteria bacterium]